MSLGISITLVLMAFIGVILLMGKGIDLYEQHKKEVEHPKILG